MNTNIEKFRVGNDNHLIDMAGNHFVNGRCVNPLGESQSELDLVYSTVKDEEGNVVGYTSNIQAGLGDPIGSTYPPKSQRVYFKVLGHIPLEEINGKMYVKRGFEHLINQ